jgi:uncharacterized protein (TIGR01777 family)
MTPGRIILAGGTGFLGRALAHAWLSRGAEVVVLTRRPRPDGGAREVAWDGRTPGAWGRELEAATAVVNLAGRSVDCRYTPENRRAVLESRVYSVRAIGEAIGACIRPPRVWVQAGSLAVHGNAGDRVLDDTSPPGEGFSADVCRSWEAAFEEWPTPRTRKVFLRIAFVLGRGGALATLARLARLGLGGTIGPGRQYVSWLHVDDFVRLVDWAIARDEATGVYAATGPLPVRNAVFMRTLRRAVRRPIGAPAPAWAVRLGARLLGTEPELALHGRRGIPRRLLAEGFVFRHTDLDRALADLLREPAAASRHGRNVR